MPSGVPDRSAPPSPAIVVDPGFIDAPAPGAGLGAPHARDPRPGLLARGLPKAAPDVEPANIPIQLHRGGRGGSQLPRTVPAGSAPPGTTGWGVQLSPGPGSAPAGTGGHWSLGNTGANARFVNNLIVLGEAHATTPRGSFVVELDRVTRETRIRFLDGPYANAMPEAMPYLSLDDLVRELRLGRYEGGGLPPRLAELHRELDFYLLAGHLPPTGTVAGGVAPAPGDPAVSAAGEPRAARDPDWTRIEDPDEAWRRFHEQYPDLGDLVERAVRHDGIDRDTVLDLMRRGWSLSEALASLRDGGLAGGRIPPDVAGRVRVAGGFEEPDDAGREAMARSLGDPGRVAEVREIARALDVDPVALAQAIETTRGRGEMVRDGFRTLRMAERVEAYNPSFQHGQQTLVARDSLRMALAVWAGRATPVGGFGLGAGRSLADGFAHVAQVERAKAETPLQEALGALAGERMPWNTHEAFESVIGGPRDVTFAANMRPLREAVTRVFWEGAQKGLVPAAYRVALVTEVIPDELFGISDEPGNILLNADRLLQRGGTGTPQGPDPMPAFDSRALRQAIGYELGPRMLGEAVIDEEPWPRASPERDRLIRPARLVAFGQAAFDAREAMAGFAPSIAARIGPSLDVASPEDALWIWEELAAELAAAAWAGTPVPAGVHRLAEAHLPEGYMDKVGPHLVVVPDGSP